ncbi:hypothetical protein R6Q59_007887 [Mikania micrantha]
MTSSPLPERLNYLLSFQFQSNFPSNRRRVSRMLSLTFENYSFIISYMRLPAHSPSPQKNNFRFQSCVCSVNNLFCCSESILFLIQYLGFTWFEEQVNLLSG